MKVLSIDVGMTNLGICIVRYERDRQVPYVIEHWEKINLRVHTAGEATKSIVDAFFKRPQCYEVDYVVIESQERAVEKMKRLSNAIQAHFETARVLSNKSFGVTWSSGDVKLRVYEGEQTWAPIKSKSRYRINKRLGEEHTRAILTEGVLVDDPDCKKWLSWFEKLSKQDDAADCFLQGAFFLKHLNMGNPSMVYVRKTPISGDIRATVRPPPHPSELRQERRKKFWERNREDKERKKRDREEAELDECLIEDSCSDEEFILPKIVEI